MDSDQAKLPTATRIVRRPAGAAPVRVSADICVLGAGIAGVSAALEAARLGRKVALVDALPALGGQAVNSIIGTFCGLFANGTHGVQLTHGIADDILRELGAQGALHYRRGGPSNTTVVMYDEIALSRWVEEAVRKAGITVLLGAVLRGVARDGARIRELDLATRYGDVKLAATGFVDATGDAVLTWEAGFACREPADGPVYGTQMMVLEGIDEARQPTRAELTARARAKAALYGLVRTDGFAFVFPGRGTALVNHHPCGDPARAGRGLQQCSARQGAGRQGPAFPQERISRCLWRSRACAAMACPASGRRAGSSGASS